MVLDHLGPGFDVHSGAEMHGTANLVTPDFIRVDADEATYDLHVIVRFELEVADLPEAWRETYRRHLGVEGPDDTRGCLQDAHWSCGLFGDVPTYGASTDPDHASAPRILANA